MNHDQRPTVAEKHKEARRQAAAAVFEQAESMTKEAHDTLALPTGRELVWLLGYNQFNSLREFGEEAGIGGYIHAGLDEIAWHMCGARVVQVPRVNEMRLLVDMEVLRG